MTETRAGSRIVLRNTLRERHSPYDLAGDARAGLANRPRTLPSKYFYDERGSHLFEMITRLPEYYLTRSETEILEREAGHLVEAVQPRILVEFGSGAARKTRILLDAMSRRGLLDGYGPVDVSADASRQAANTLIRDYPEIMVEGVIGDFERPRDLPFAGRPRLFVFLGSTIGNLESAQATLFLRSIRGEMTAADAFLIGFDLVKDVAILERAYNDDAGVTAMFNLNVLRVLNRELGGTFDLEAFRHRAVWNEAESRIEMYLVSMLDQRVRVPSIGLDVELDEGETIRTELCHKYTAESARLLLEAAGYAVESWCTDASGYFALALVRRS
jgi:L-histidine N-alpha-methyltransferase